ncbi:MAG: tRNA (adenosine(37)-N6)-dimethylallyltransferase MiaA, partial [Prevotella sp.]|nr:tRNA (adenosine(37)-N6)-dimethylallyltransferase MiaA [Prevotella sp.]
MPELIVITGPTASGKSQLAVDIASRIGCDIISADSRQIYRGLPIGTAAPSPEQLTRVRHHFVSCLDLEEYYSAARFEDEVMKLLPVLWQTNERAVMCGGSMMYVQAVTKGLDQLPTISESVRKKVIDLYDQIGLDGLMAQLKILDSAYADKVDPHNTKRVMHALEICFESGGTYSELRTGTTRRRNFAIRQYAIDLPRDVLFDRINTRVDAMIEAGLEDEARGVYHLKHLNSLNTVGYKELFA